ncbi:MAG: HU family DNA-binding protein [Bacteroidales bacterium]|nr:HU family DNA-binding protein [Bacteroidales bacterium]
MNKSELVGAIAEGAQLSKVQAKAALDAAIEAIAAALAKDDKVTLVGFGTFAVAKKEERKGINPRTKEAITIPARKTIKFKAGSELNDKVK